MSEEKLKILQMVQEGKVTPGEGLELLKALEEAEATPVAEPNPNRTRLSNRFLHIRVQTADTTKVNVNIPLNLVKVASKFAAFGINHIPEAARREMLAKGIDLSQIDLEELVVQIEQGLVDGKLVDIDTNDPHEGPVKVEVYVD